jgi:aldose 1-epimerase
VIQLEAGDYRATVTPTGGALVALQYCGRDLVRHVERDPPMPLYRGAVLAPWPNRIANGRYQYAGTSHQLPINEVTRGCALHGLVLWTTWQVIDADASHVLLSDTIWPQPGYPFTVQVAVHYRLDATSGLTVTVSARNVGGHVAPYGTSIHPYLVAGDGSVDDWTLELDAHEVLLVDAGRLLPRQRIPVTGTPFDFRGGKQIGPTAIDHAFTSVKFAADGTAQAIMSASDGAGVRLTWDETCQWVQVHTTDLPGTEVNRLALAFEPMTCPPDAFNSKESLIELEPGERHTAWWRIEANDVNLTTVPGQRAAGP